MRRRLALLVLVASAVAAGTVPHVVNAAPVKVTDAKTGQPCSKIVVESPVVATGGCELRTIAGGIDMAIVSPLSHFVFATCGLGYNIRIDGSGKTLLETVRVFGLSPCFDVEACFPGSRETKQYTYRWKGRIRAVGDRLEHIIDACMDTCVGRFEGRIVTNLRRTDRGWRASTEVGSVGSSGWQMRGARWDWKPMLSSGSSGGPGIEIKAAS